MKEGTDNNRKVNKHKKNTQNKSSKGIEASGRESYHYPLYLIIITKFFQRLSVKANFEELK